MTTIYVLDGNRINTLEAFWQVITETFGDPYGYFGRNLDAFADALSGGPGGPEADDYRVEWLDHATSRTQLGYEETVRQLELRLRRCHPESRDHVARQLEAARAERGPTVFDWLIEIFEERAPGALLLH